MIKTNKALTKSLLLKHDHNLISFTPKTIYSHLNNTKN